MDSCRAPAAVDRNGAWRRGECGADASGSVDDPLSTGSLPLHPDFRSRQHRWNAGHQLSAGGAASLGEGADRCQLQTRAAPGGPVQLCVRSPSRSGHLDVASLRNSFSDNSGVMPQKGTFDMFRKILMIVLFLAAVAAPLATR